MPYGKGATFCRYRIQRLFVKLKNIVKNYTYVKILFMKQKILYLGNKIPTHLKNYPLIRTKELRRASLEEYPIVVIEEPFLKKIRFPSQIFKEKLCFINFGKEERKNIERLNRCGFFDYFTEEDDRKTISFKLKRAYSFLRLKREKGILENKLSHENKKIKDLLIFDPIAKCYNWRYFYLRAQEELVRSQRYSYPVSFMVIDIDHLSQINEIYNIKVGDAVIRQLVKILKKNLRKEDILCRWRGDEFIVILPYQSANKAYLVGKRIKEKVTLYPFRYKNIRLKINVGIGITSSLKDNIYTPRDVINALERCLLNIKSGEGSLLLYSRMPSNLSLETSKAKANILELKNKIEELNKLLKRDVSQTIYAFAKTIEAKDFYTGRHIEDTASLAEKIAKELKLSPTEIENIKYAAVLHDLGKIAINEKILSKKGHLNAQEKEIINTHPLIAAEILREIHTLRGAIPAILYHHERYDGKGYPMGLKGEEIPLGARIVALSDVYHALISNRPYRKALSKKKALQIIKKESGRQFDPQIVKIFLKVVEKE